jgi:hypothetical protein
MHLSWLDPHKMRRITVVGRDKMAVFDDMELDRKLTIYDKGPVERAETYGEWMTRPATSKPEDPNDEPLRLECEHFLRLVAGEGDPLAAARDGVAVVRATRATAGLAGADAGLSFFAAETAVVLPGTVIGDDCQILDFAVVGKQQRCRHARPRSGSRCHRSSSAPARSSRPARSSSPARSSASA